MCKEVGIRITSAFAGYIVSLLVTILVMNYFQASHVFPFEQLNNFLEYLFCIRLVAMQRLSLGLLDTYSIGLAVFKRFEM